MNFYEEYNLYSKELQKIIFDLKNRELENFVEIHNKHTEMLSERAKLALKTLGYYGWYIPSLDHPVTFPSKLADELNNNNEEYVNNEMSKLLIKNFKLLSNEILKNNQNRVHILKQAFMAHNSQKYALSVPVFLSQADGICKEVTNYGLFFKENKLPKTKVYVDNLVTNTFLLSYLEPLRTLLPIIYSDEYLEENMKFNRHKILHGEDFTYDNELTSLKAFSLLCYINTFLHYK
jgi:hypothetical protein